MSLPELIDAMLDGELSSADEQRVRDWLATDPQGGAELESHERVRSMVRSLSPVEPPPGFFERLEQSGLPEATGHRPARRHRRRPRRAVLGGALGAAAAVAAALVLVLGITPAADRILPPVQAFADRHSEVSGPASAHPHDTDGFRQLPEAEVDAVGAPYVVPASLGPYSRRSAYERAGTVHLLYSTGSRSVSVFEQRGALDWDGLGAAGQRQSLASVGAWTTRAGNFGALVMEMNGLVITVISPETATGTETETEMVSVATLIPAPLEPSMMDRLNRKCSSVVRSLTGGG